MEYLSPLVSIIVPVYNVEKYVGRCLQSLINQTYTHIEIIVINDGSTDNSLSVCDSYAAKDNRIKLITQENRGLSGARNTGLRHYTGEYVTFVDSDDWLHPQMIELLYDAIVRYECEMSLCESLRVSSDNISEKKHVVNKCLFYNAELMMNYFLDTSYTACWSRLFKRELVADLWFPEGLNCEDFLYMYEAIRKIKKGVAVVEIPLYYYFDRPDSIVNNSFSIKKFDEFYSAKKLFELVCEHTPQYKSQSLPRLAGAILSLVIRSRIHGGFEKQEYEMVSFLRNNAPLFLFNKYILWKMRVLLFFLILPKKLSVLCCKITRLI